MLSNRYLKQLARQFRRDRENPYGSGSVLMQSGGHVFLDTRNALPATVEFAQDQVATGDWCKVSIDLAGVEVFEVVSVSR